MSAMSRLAQIETEAADLAGYPDDTDADAPDPRDGCEVYAAMKHERWLRMIEDRGACLWCKVALPDDSASLCPGCEARAKAGELPDVGDNLPFLSF